MALRIRFGDGCPRSSRVRVLASLPAPPILSLSSGERAYLEFSELRFCGFAFLRIQTTRYITMQNRLGVSKQWHSERMRFFVLSVLLHMSFYYVFLFCCYIGFSSCLLDNERRQTESIIHNTDVNHSDNRKCVPKQNIWALQISDLLAAPQRGVHP